VVALHNLFYISLGIVLDSTRFPSSHFLRLFHREYAIFNCVGLGSSSVQQKGLLFFMRCWLTRKKFLLTVHTLTLRSQALNSNRQHYKRFAHRPSSIVHRPSSIVHRPSSIVQHPAWETSLFSKIFFTPSPTTRPNLRGALATSRIRQFPTRICVPITTT
jgi:hypothetical protein